jgi:hypothetical protein
MYDEAQVSHNQLARRVKVFVVIKATGERLLVFLAQYFDRTNGVDVGIETTYWSRQYEVVIPCCNSCRHLYSQFQSRF